MKDQSRQRQTKLQFNAVLFFPFHSYLGKATFVKLVLIFSLAFSYLLSY
jgi:hypothetical protein